MKPSDLAAALEQRRAENLYRALEVRENVAGTEVVIGGERLLAFCSNDYLGLAGDPRVIAALQDGARRYGAGAGASHLLGGHSQAHHALEEELADFSGAERALLFSTGYMANLGVVSALMDRHGTILEDRLNHASLIDAARLSRARTHRYPHADMVRLKAMLAENGSGDALILSDGVFSMDGDIAPLDRLHALAVEHDTWLMLDDAHGFGVLGAGGRGTFEEFGLVPGGRAILMGTLGKAFGVAGAFVAGSRELIDTLVQGARTYVYTTALPPPLAEALRTSLALVRAESWRREHLQARVLEFRAGAAALGLPLAPSTTAIQPVTIGDSARALAVSRRLRASGILVPAIRPPTVPAGTARLRVTFSAAHEPQHVERLLEALAAAFREQK